MVFPKGLSVRYSEERDTNLKFEETNEEEEVSFPDGEPRSFISAQ